MRNRILLLAIFMFITAACGGASLDYILGETLLEEGFSEATAWENFTAEDVILQVSDGVYRARTGPGGYTWGLNDTEHTDVVIEVEADQTSVYENNAYGVMCRADTSNNGDGYYFLVSGDGFYSIRKGEEENVNPLVDTDESADVGAEVNADIAFDNLTIWAASLSN